MMKIFRMSASMLTSVAVLCVVTATGSAQHLISSKAGFVNRADGKVMILRRDSEDGEKGRVSLGTQMRNGDRLFTEAGSYAEVLLNPGSYLRMDEKTEVVSGNTSLSQISFELVTGTINLEVGEVDKKAPIEISTGKGDIFIVKQGIYRIDARGGLVTAAARQGDLLLGTRDDALLGKGYRIAKGKSAMLGSSAPQLDKIDKDKIDNFDVWCFNRAQTVMAANQTALRQSRSSSGLAYGWFFDPFSSTYTFIPRRGLFWSPYGFGFFSNFSDCFTCGYWPYGYFNYGNRWPSTGGAGGGAPNAPARVVAGIERAPIRREMEGRALGGSSVFDSGVSSRGFGDMGGSRSISSSPAATSVIAMPAPSRGGDSGGGAAPSRPAGPSRP